MDLFPKLSQIFEGNGRLARFIPQPEASLSVIQVMSSLTSLEAQTQMASMESCCLRNLVLPKRCVYSFVLSNLMPLRIGGMMCRKGCFYEQVFWTMCAKSEEPGHSRTQQECPWPSRAVPGPSGLSWAQCSQPVLLRGLRRERCHLLVAAGEWLGAGPGGAAAVPVPAGALPHPGVPLQAGDRYTWEESRESFGCFPSHCLSSCGPASFDLVLNQ